MSTDALLLLGVGIVGIFLLRGSASGFLNTPVGGVGATGSAPPSPSQRTAAGDYAGLATSVLTSGGTALIPLALKTLSNPDASESYKAGLFPVLIRAADAGAKVSKRADGAIVIDWRGTPAEQKDAYDKYLAAHPGLAVRAPTTTKATVLHRAATPSATVG